MDELVRTAARSHPAIVLHHTRSRVVDVERYGAQYRLKTEDGSAATANLVVLSPGHPPPSQPSWATAESSSHPRFIADPWRPEALRPIRPLDEVLIIGTGLTMADVVASLKAQGHRGAITAISRRGLTPRPRTTLPVEAFGSFDRNPTPSVAHLLRRVRIAVRQAALEGRPWECVVDALRQQATPVWQALSPESRRSFLRHLRPWWDSHRYQIAPQLDRILGESQQNGRLKILKATVRSLRPFEGSLQAVLRLRGASAGATAHRFFDAVVNCTGPDHGTVVAFNPVLNSLSECGLLRADAFGLGVEVDHLARVIGHDGRPSPNLFVAGPLARGYFGELMGLPQVSAQPERLALHVADLLRRADPLERLVAAG
jgi:uncharacterized NAD(P)/FAD-binding protein YdhS